MLQYRKVQHASITALAQATPHAGSGSNQRGSHYSLNLSSTSVTLPNLLHTTGGTSP
jgi:hypothetical protein